MLAGIAIFLSSISIILMLVILIKFKKLFSTESIIEKTKSQMNRVIMDVNNNANRDLELINESTRRTKALINEADKKMENFKEATEILRNMIAEAEKVSKKSNKSFIYSDIEGLANIKPVGYKEAYTKKEIDPEATFEIIQNKEKGQGSLFDEQIEQSSSIIKDETKVTADGAAFKEVPLIITKVYDDKTNEIKKSSQPLNEKVEKLFRQGMQIDDIAAELSCSISEVQFIIDML